jgi:hypothetical protein
MRAVSAEAILEVKRFPDGTRQEFACEAVSRSRNLLVVRFRHPAARDAGGFHFPTGSVSYGFFWRRRPYVLYAIRDPQNQPLAYRFDVVSKVRLRRNRVEYLDLALDVWVDPSGRTWLEDQAELALMVDRGLVSPEERLLIERTGRYLLRRGRIIAAQAEAILSR